MSNVLKIKIAGQRIKYDIAKVRFNEEDLQQAKSWQWDYKGNHLYYNDNKLDILRDYETFNCEDIGVAIRTNGEIFYELGYAKGKIMKEDANVLSALTHPILNAIDDANDGDGMTLVSADVYDNENTIYEYIVEVSDSELFDGSQLEIITINDPITNEEYIVELRYNSKKMIGGADGLLYREPASDKSMFMLTVPKDYADALGLNENRRLKKILKFDDFIKEEHWKDGKSLKEDYIHSFINEHEPDHEPDEEE
jgi:hypothetical protein